MWSLETALMLNPIALIVLFIVLLWDKKQEDKEKFKRKIMEKGE